MALPLPRPIKTAIFAILRGMPAIERRVLPSAGYRLITESEARQMQSGSAGWLEPDSAAWQQRAYTELLADMASGHPRADFQVIANAVDACGHDTATLLEAGCGGGYHSHVLSQLCTTKISYVGSDYSPAMVAEAQARFPQYLFSVADSTKLPFADTSFDIVMDGVAIMHIFDHRRAIAEMARVAGSHVILHSVPVFNDHPDAWLFKFAYGEAVTERVANRAGFEADLAAAGLEIIHSAIALPYDVARIVGAQSHSRTYVCRKIKRDLHER